MKAYLLLIATVSIILYASPGWAYQARDPFHDTQGPGFGTGRIGPATSPERTFGASDNPLQPAASGVQPGSAEEDNLRRRGSPNSSVANGTSARSMIRFRAQARAANNRRTIRSIRGSIKPNCAIDTIAT